jgi:hypothetical protein
VKFFGGKVQREVAAQPGFATDCTDLHGLVLLRRKEEGKFFCQESEKK